MLRCVASVPRFISSDFCSDYTKTEPGHNRNFDLRREFMGRADRAPISVTSVMNGAFMDMLGAEMPIVQPRIHRVLYWGSPDQPLDFTTRDDTAAYTAAAALDGDHPASAARRRRHGQRSRRRPPYDRVVGTRRTARCGRAPSGYSPRRHAQPKPLHRNQQRCFPPGRACSTPATCSPGDARLQPLDNDRYPDLRWTTLRDRFSNGHLPGSQS